MKELDGKTVRFISTDKRYMRVPYPAIAPESKEMAAYVTGQHIDPEDKETRGNLTKAEMLGEVEIKPAARKNLFPYVINPDQTVFIVHMKKYNCNVDETGRPVHPRDYAEAHFILLQDVVAKDKNSMKPSKHYFYIEDREAEAKYNVNILDKRYEAEKYLREALSISDYKDIVNLLSLKHPHFNEDPERLTSLRIFEVLLKEAHDRPDNIIYMSEDAARDELFISKLVSYKIISKRVDGFYDGKSFVARTLEEMVVLLHTSEGESLQSKWGKAIKLKED